MRKFIVTVAVLLIVGTLGVSASGAKEQGKAQKKAGAGMSGAIIPDYGKDTFATAGARNGSRDSAYKVYREFEKTLRNSAFCAQ